MKSRVARLKKGWTRRKALQWAQYGLPVLMLAGVFWLDRGEFSRIDEFRHWGFDGLQRLRPRPYEDAPVRLIDIDDASLEKAGQWPWPRTRVAALIRGLGKAGAAAVAFDVVFAEPDRTSPSAVAEEWRKVPELRGLLPSPKGLPDHERFMARAMAEVPVVTAFFLTGTPGGRDPLEKARFKLTEDAVRFLTPYLGAVPTLPALEKTAAGNGCVTIRLDPDGVVRRVPLIVRLDSGGFSIPLPALSLETLRVFKRASTISARTSAAAEEGTRGASTGLTEVEVRDAVLPVDARGAFWIYYTRDSSRRVIPAWKALEGALAPEELAGKIAVVGTSAAGLKDLRRTPLDPAYPGALVHVQALEQALLGRFLLRPDWAIGAEWLYVLAVAMALVALLPRLGPGWCALAAGASIAAAWAVSWQSFTGLGWLVDAVFPTAAIAAVYAASSLISHLRTELERRQVRGAFSRYMSPVLVEVLARHPERLRLGGEMRELTLHFCDIRGFTTISEQFDPEGLTRFINRFLTPMTQIILDHQGTIDKYMGDCIMAFWNAPIDDPEHAVRACRAALAMHRRLADLNRELESEAKTAGRKFIPIHIGTGLNTGLCCVGNMGSDQRFDYSVLGDDVNLASRLEGQSKSYGADIVIGPRTRDRAKDFAALELDLLRVKGKTVPVRIHALLGDEKLRADSGFQALAPLHEELLAAYRGRDWDRAEELLAQCRSLGKPLRLDKLYHLYEDRIAAFRRDPPPPDWDGAATATSK